MAGSSNRVKVVDVGVEVVVLPDGFIADTRVGLLDILYHLVDIVCPEVSDCYQFVRFLLCMSPQLLSRATRSGSNRMYFDIESSSFFFSRRSLLSFSCASARYLVSSLPIFASLTLFNRLACVSFSSLILFSDWTIFSTTCTSIDMYDLMGLAWKRPEEVARTDFVGVHEVVCSQTIEHLLDGRQGDSCLDAQLLNLTEVEHVFLRESEATVE